MAIDTATGQVIDITGGRADLSAGSIRMVSAAAFRADPIRLLRAFRFASRLGFAVDPQTLATISRDAGLIAQSPGERIRDELFKLLAATAAHPHVSAMQAAVLLQAIFPDVEPTAVEPALQSMRALETILEGFPGLPPDLAARLSAEFQERRRVVLKCAALLRSIAPSRQGAAVDRLRLSKRDSSRMECLLRPQSLPQEPSPAAGMLTADALRFFQAAGDFAPDLLILEMAVGREDAALPPAPPRAALAGILRMLRDYFYRYRPRALSPPALTGSDLIREFGLRRMNPALIVEGEDAAEKHLELWYLIQVDDSRTGRMTMMKIPKRPIKTRNFLSQPVVFTVKGFFHGGRYQGPY